MLDVAIAPARPEVWQVACDVGGVFRTENSGISWRMIHNTLPLRTANYSIRSLSVPDENPNELLIAAGSHWFEPEGVYRTTAAGRSWQAVLRALLRQ